ncbi:alkylation response protein AidB-like acyl-CoA dehydrogenase [Streptomyces achromogenes]|uniref:Alkylation response protein AidB-like acyl-CoA dehydrogenase n=1 Tax=Streptomyces achromogenes TaxID=67255 RepID=A0ABU0PSK4_STRAH|nr:oxidoreductase [Streptomyces achromogenes]MDQ0681364.1 alkylation response protein AidB-like acyl-CoA dehydrogenase [Streptomyces achromogenes]
MLSDLGKTLDIAREDRLLLDETCRLTERLADSVVDNGFARHFVPERWNGGAGTFTALLDAVSELAETCASTAWCAALYAAHGRLAGYLPEAGQREIWCEGPDVRVAASVVPPQGSAVRTDGGWRLTGRWATASGVDQAEWMLLASWAALDDDPAGETREHRIFAVRRQEMKVLHTWRPVGLRGTGSNTVEGDVLVPDHLTFTLGDLGRVQPHAARCHAVPFALVASLVFAAPVLGAAEGALRTWWETQIRRARPDGGTAVQPLVLARASAHIQAARLLLERVAQRGDHAPVTPVLVAENQRDVAVAVELCGTAVDELFRTAGLRALEEDDALQRHWRDITAARTHGTLDFGSAASGYASALLAARAGEETR